MSYLSAIREEQRAIVGAIHNAILDGMIDAYDRCVAIGGMPQEPDVVASLVFKSTPLIHDAFTKILKPHRMNVSVLGVYCHQTPKVCFQGIQKTSCELGDLLLVHNHTSRSGCSLRNALLYQAKMTARQPHRLSPSESDQLQLFTRWPDFWYHASGNLTGIKRSVKPKMYHTGAQYLLIDKRPLRNISSELQDFTSRYLIGSCMPDEILHDHSDLASEIFKFFTYRSGRTFEDRSDSIGQEDWSELVWDLIGVGVTKAFTRRSSGHVVASRSSGDFNKMNDGNSFTCATDATAYPIAKQVLGSCNADILFARADYGNVDNERSNMEITNPLHGISMILIETSESDEMEKK